VAVLAGVAGEHGQAEVHDPRMAASVEHHVCGLQVAVQDPLLVRRGQACAQTTRDLEPLVLRQAPDPPQERREVLAVHVLHHQEMPPLALDHVVDATDVRVRHLAPEPHLRVEARELLLVDRVGQELQGDGLPQLQVLRPVHLAHPAAAQERHDAKATGENSARGEAGPAFDEGTAERHGAAGRRRRRIIPRGSRRAVSLSVVRRVRHDSSGSGVAGGQ
jgi:hypothetical protein